MAKPTNSNAEPGKIPCRREFPSVAVSIPTGRHGLLLRVRIVAALHLPGLDARPAVAGRIIGHGDAEQEHQLENSGAGENPFQRWQPFQPHEQDRDYRDLNRGDAELYDRPPDAET